MLHLGCSYGINAALLKHNLSVSDLYEYWGNEARTKVTSEEIVAGDQQFFGDLDDPENIEIIGLD